MKKPYLSFFSIRWLYEKLFRRILSKDDGIDAENLTKISLSILGEASIRREWPGISNLLQEIREDLSIYDPRLEQKLFGCNFKNPLGLAAGFDKDGIAAAIWEDFGFGFVELGTVTWHKQKGNPRPRLFRLASDQAALNRMGFNNNGATVMRRTLERQNLPLPGQRLAIIGLNFGKSRVTSFEDAPNDYALSLEMLSSLSDYAVINVSSPNTPGLRDLQNSNHF